MTTGRINQVATTRCVAQRRSSAPARGSLGGCGISIASLHQFRNCRVPLLRSSVCAPSELRGGHRRENGLSCTSASRFNLCSEHRRTALLGACNYIEWTVGINHGSIQLQNKSTGHPKPDQLALSVKAKKEKQTRRFANQAFA